MKLKLLILIFAWYLAIGYWSFCHAVRPLYTEDAWVIPRGKLYLESGVLLLTERDNSGVNEITTAFRYGFAKNHEFLAEIPYLCRYSLNENYDGLSNGSVKFKYNFYNVSEEYASFLIGILPGDPQSNKTTHNDLNTMLIYSNAFGDYSYNFNFGYTFDGDNSGAPKNDFIIYNVSLIKPLNGSIIILGELQYSKNTYTYDIVGETAIGLNYIYSDKLTFDTALGCGLNENSSSSNFVVGLTYLLYP